MRSGRFDIRDFSHPIIIKNKILNIISGEVTLENQNNALNQQLDLNLEKDQTTNYEIQKTYGDIVLDDSLYLNNNGSTDSTERIKIKIHKHSSLKIKLNDTLIEFDSKDYFVEAIEKSAINYEVIYLILREKV